MKIGIDARWIFREISGIGAYTRELLRQLAALDSSNEYVAFFNDPVVRDAAVAYAGLDRARNFTPHLVPSSPLDLRNQLHMPAEIQRLRLDIFHTPNYMIPMRAFRPGPKRSGRTRCVVTLHDVIPLIFPDHAPKSRKARLFPLYRWVMREVGRRADVIIAASQSTRSDIFRELGIPPEGEHRVAVIYHGVAPEFRPAPRVPGGSRTILYVGRLDSYKNVTRLVESFAQIAPDLPDVRLHILGPDDPRYPEARRRAEELGVAPRVTWSGHVSGPELLRAYQQADVYALPSRYEGFGLTVLEAMACGTPVVCTNVSSLPEVAGDAALLVPPDDTRALADALRRVLSDPALWKELSDKGPQQAARFSWRSTAEQTIEVYRRLATNREPA